MSNLQKFNQTLKDFNQEVEQLKDVSGVLKKIQQLADNQNSITKKFEENSKNLNSTNELLKIQQEKVTKSLSDIENTNLQAKLEFLELIENKTDLIHKENKDFYKDFESTIKIKLDDNKSQIKQLIENERLQIKQIFEIEFAKTIKELNIEIENKIKSVKVAVWIMSGLILLALLSIIAIFIKSF